MDNSISNVSFDYNADQTAIARRQEMAKALQAQSMQPMETQMVGGWAIPNSPWQGAAKLGQAYAGALQSKKAQEGQKELAAKAQTDAMRWASERPQGTPGSIQDTTQQGTGSMDMSGAAGPANVAPTQPSQQEMMAWMLRGGSNPVTAPIAKSMMEHSLKQDEPYTLPEGAQRVGPGGTLIRENPKDFRPQQQNPSDLDRLLREKAALPLGDPRIATYDNAIRKASETTKQITNVNQPAPVTPVTIQDPNDPNGTLVIDGRTKAVLGKGPKLTQAGAMNQKREFNMQGIGSTLQEAEDLLTGKATGTKPTGSGVGAAIDYAGGLIGRSPSGSVEAAKLKSVGGALVSKMPRMEGPQSDKDVALYKEMAGKVGDATVPVEQRLAALETVKGLWAKYEKHNPEAFADRRAVSASGGVDALLEKYK